MGLVYFPTFGGHLWQMSVNISYINPMGIVLVRFFSSTSPGDYSVLMVFFHSNMFCIYSQMSNEKKGPWLFRVYKG